MQDKNNRRNIFYTSSVINTLYGLKSSNVIRSKDNNISYAVSKATINGVEYPVGLCTRTNDYHIFSPFEKLFIDILLSWSELSKDEYSEETKINEFDSNINDVSSYTRITFEDIDWIRNRNKTNKNQRQKEHELYKSTVESLGNLLFIFDKKDNKYVKYNLFNYRFIYTNDNIDGIEYNFGQLQKSLVASNQKVSINYNPFRYSRNNYIKYQLFRYLLVSIYMNRTKKKKFKRSHNAILKSTVWRSDKETISYFDNIVNKTHVNTYLRRYSKHVLEILDDLKQVGFIYDYKIINDTSRRHLITAAGYVEIENVSYKRQNYR